MANLLTYDATQMLAFVLVFIRIGAILSTAPLFGHPNIPIQIKVVLSLSFAVLLHPFIPRTTILPEQLNQYLILMGGELLIGLALGMIGQLVFAAVEFAGSLTGFQMGLSMANVFDPQSRQQISLIARFENVLAMLVFLATNAHLFVIEVIVNSYKVLPPGGVGLGQKVYDQVLLLSSGIFSIGFQLAAPLVIALFLANVIMGLLARSVPQIQIFTVGFPLTILLGLFLIALGVPFLTQAVRIMFESYDNQLFNMLRALKQAP